MDTYTHRALDVNELLLFHARIISEQQLKRLFGATRWIRRLEEFGHIARDRVTLHPELELYEPVCSWAPGLHRPNAARVSASLKRRWTKQPKPMTVFHATRNAYQHMGLVPPSRRLRHTQLEHDLHCTSIYIHLRLEHHHDAHNWVSDDLWKRLVHRRFVKKRFVAKPPAEKVPDAHLVQNGTPYRVIDFGGSYSAARVDALIDYAQATNLPIQIW